MPSMNLVLRFLETTRLYLLIFTLPPAILWFSTTPAADAAVPSAFVATIIILAHSLLILLHATSFDVLTLRAGATPRLALSANPESWNLDNAERLRVVYALLLGVCILLLLVTSITAAAAVAVAGILVGLLTGGINDETRRWRMMFSEVLWPGLMLLTPMIILGWMYSGISEQALAITAPATGVAAVALAAYVLLCLIRDQSIDAGDRLPTTATLLGRAGVTTILFVLLCLAIVLTSRGVGWEWWHWPTASITGIGALAVFWCVSSGSEDSAPALWTLGSALVGFTMLMEL